MKYQFKQVALMQANVASANIGDEIISRYCRKNIEEIFPNSQTVVYPTQMLLDKRAKGSLERSDLAIVCGTNLLASNMKKRRQWNVGNTEKKLKTKFILCGVGWWQYQDDPDFYTKRLLQNILSKEYIHSVRDEYSRQMLLKCGISNVVNTSCPSMWNLTKDNCVNIPRKKASQVVMTLTDYKRNPDTDKLLFQILENNYKKRYLWLQSYADYEYLNEIGYISDSFEILPPTLVAYEGLLKEGNIDYVGTRLHGGIHAINHGIRTIILATDNRATEIAKDTGLQVVERYNTERIQLLINTEWETDIKIPNEAIRTWKSQFVVS